MPRISAIEHEFKDYPPYSEQKSFLTVRDIERLAAAGVKIDFKDIATQVTPDLVAPPPPVDDLTSAFWDRYRRNQRARHGGNHYFDDGVARLFAVMATEGKDKINVYVAPADGSEPFILQDEKCLYPSDALFAALDLHEATRGKT